MITHPHVKINLGLSVIRKRADGYHDLETVFVPYRDISDTLEIVPADTFGETAAPLFARYGQEQVVQDISPDGKLMITLARTWRTCSTCPFPGNNWPPMPPGWAATARFSSTKNPCWEPAAARY